MYNSQSGPFGLCSDIWDEKEKKFKRSDETDKAICCFNTCKPFVEKCVNTCSKASTAHFEELCYNTCHDIKESCKNNCLLSGNSWGINNPIYNGTRKFKCGDGFGHPIDEKCMKDHKYGIIKECQKNCLPTSDLDCQKHCEYSYDFLIDDSTDPLSFKRNEITNRRSTQGKNNNLVLYMIIAIIVIGVIGVIVSI